MTKYIVHLYREMRISFVDIEADTPQAAAAIAHDKLTDDADNIEDCNGDDLSALVDVAGDEHYSQSVTIYFEPERQRKAASAVLASLQPILPYAENEGRSLAECWRRDDEAVARIEAETCEQATEAARAAIAEAKGVIPPQEPPVAARFEIEHDPRENPDRAYVLVDGFYDVAILRTGEGIVIDVYPKDWIDPIDTMTVWDEQVAATHEDAE